MNYHKNSIGALVSDDDNYVQYLGTVYEFVEARVGNCCRNCDLMKAYGLGCGTVFPCQTPGKGDEKFPDLRTDGKGGYFRKCEIVVSLCTEMIDTRSEDDKLVCDFTCYASIRFFYSYYII